MSALLRLYTRSFGGLQAVAGDWFLGLAARLVFASVLLFYFFNSALTKLGTGPLGFLMPSDGAYAQILPSVTESAGYDISQISFFPYGLVVLLGTWAEFLLPFMVIVGLFTRLSSLAMIGFIAVMTYVDVYYHGIGEKAIGAPFDRFHDAMVADQRLLWLFPLVYLVVRGPGLLSLDRVLAWRAPIFRY